MTSTHLGSLDQIPIGEGRQFLVGAEAIAVFRTRDGAVLATQALCPHARGRLADGLVGGGRVVCPMHAYAFDLATGCAKASACGNLRTYRVAVDEAGQLRLELGDAATEAA